MSIARIQTAPVNKGAESTSARTVTFGTSTTAGNLIVVSVTTYDNVTVTVADGTNTYTQIGTYVTNGPPKVSMWYAKNIAGGAVTITVTPSGLAFVNICATEYSGANTSAPLDSSTTNAGGASTTFTTGSVTVSQAGDLVVGAFSYNGNNTGVSGNGAFAILMADLDANFDCTLVVDGISDVSVAPSATLLSANSFAGIGASFKAASAGGGGGLVANTGMRGGML